MAIHLVKLCVGATEITDLKRRINIRSLENQKTGRGKIHDHVTRMWPRREDELINGGSLYWVIKGAIVARQTVIRLEKVTGLDEISRCAIILKPQLIHTVPQPKRAFQGWRYLKPDDAPQDLSKTDQRVPPALRHELAELGIL